MEEDIIIIGAGPAGLIAAYELAKQHRKALILEARDRIGGRAFTIAGNDGTHIESGAEFVHGKLPITLALLRLAGLSYTATAGRWVQLKGGKVAEEREGRDWPQLMRKLKALKEDMTLQDFLDRHFADSEYTALKDRAIAFAEGYDSADASRVSAKALYEEWSKEEEEQFRVDKGYSALMDFLAEEFTDAGSRILLSHPVSSIITSDSRTIVVAGGQKFSAAKVIVALPLGVLQSGVVQFNPSSRPFAEALQALGMGEVIKFVLRFRQAFWEQEYPGLGFLMSAAPVPTWWTQAPQESTVLTGWMTGRGARAHAGLSAYQLQNVALTALSQIFSMQADVLEDLLEDAHVANWTADRYTMGAYAYATVGAGDARAILSSPLHGQVFFAGEYMYDGPAMGTVEAAFHSGIEAVRSILRQ